MLSESIDDEPVKMKAANFDAAIPRFANSAARTAREFPEALTAACAPDVQAPRYLIAAPIPLVSFYCQLCRKQRIVDEGIYFVCRVFSFFLKFTGLFVFSDTVPFEIPAVHRDIHALRQTLSECKRTSQIEQPVRTPELEWNHGARKDDRLFQRSLSKDARRFFHGIRAMGNDNVGFPAFEAIVQNDCPVGLGHLEAVDHHQGPDIHLYSASAQLEHFGQVRIPEKKPALELVIFFVECSSGYEYPNDHVLSGPV
jgi:hypothetical protein